MNTVSSPPIISAAMARHVISAASATSMAAYAARESEAEAEAEQLVQKFLGRKVVRRLRQERLQAIRTQYQGSFITGPAAWVNTIDDALVARRQVKRPDIKRARASAIIARTHRTARRSSTSPGSSGDDPPPGDPPALPRTFSADAVARLLVLLTTDIHRDLLTLLWCRPVPVDRELEAEVLGAIHRSARSVAAALCALSGGVV